MHTVKLLSGRVGQDPFGDGEASFAWGILILHFVRDRGQEFVDLSPAHDPERRFRLDDVAVALGWRRTSEVVARTEPVPLEEELGDIASRQSEVESAFAPRNLREASIAIERAVAQREQAFLDKLRQLSESGGR
jgi:hypothetical protein